MYKICIVSSEFQSMSIDSDTGIYYTLLGEYLARVGCSVTFLYAHGLHLDNNYITHWVNYHKNKGIELVAIKIENYVSVIEAVRSYEVYRWLKANDIFDYIHFSCYQGLGYYSVTAKKQGLAFRNTKLFVNLFITTQYLKEVDKQFVQQSDLYLDFMERESVALSDCLISNSQYILNWVSSRSWKMPIKTLVQTFVKDYNHTSKKNNNIYNHNTKEIIYYGDFSANDGLFIFCNSLDQLCERVKTSITKVVFIYKKKDSLEINNTEYLAKKAKVWHWKTEVITNFNLADVVDYSNHEDRLVVLPYLYSKSTIEIYEFLTSGIRFISSQLYTVSEYMLNEDIEIFSFKLSPEALAKKIKTIVINGIGTPRINLNLKNHKNFWINFYNLKEPNYHLKFDDYKDSSSWPKVSICLVTHNRAHFLIQAIKSIKNIIYPNFDVILVDDGSDNPNAIELLVKLESDFNLNGWSIIRQSNKYLGAARNTAVRNSKSEFILFMDDDDIALPNEIELMVKAAVNTGSDIITCGLHEFTGFDEPDLNIKAKKSWLPIGNATTAGALFNVYGSSNALIRRTAYNDIGGCTEDYGIGQEDYEFYAKASLKGFKLQVIPEFLFYYRINSTGMLRTGDKYNDYMRSIRPYLDIVPDAIKPLIVFARAFSLDPARGINLSQINHLVDLNIKWRSKFEAALLLLETGKADLASKLMIDAILSVSNTNSIEVIFDALTKITPLLYKIDPAKARVLAKQAIEIGERSNNLDYINRIKDLNYILY